MCIIYRIIKFTKPFIIITLYFKILNQPPLTTKYFGNFDNGSKTNIKHYKIYLYNYFIIKNTDLLNIYNYFIIKPIKNHNSLLNNFRKFRSNILILFPYPNYTIYRVYSKIFFYKIYLYFLNIK